MTSRPQTTLPQPIGLKNSAVLPKPWTLNKDVVRVAKNRGLGVTVEQVATDFGMHRMTYWKWIHWADINDGARPGVSSQESAEPREARRRIKLLEQENEVLLRAAAYLSQARLPGKDSHPAPSEPPRREHRPHLPPAPCARAGPEFTAERRHPFREADETEAAAVRGGRELGAAAAVVRHRDLQPTARPAQPHGDLGGVGRVPSYVRQGLLYDAEGGGLHLVREVVGQGGVAAQGDLLDRARETVDQFGDGRQVAGRPRPVRRRAAHRPCAAWTPGPRSRRIRCPRAQGRGRPSAALGRTNAEIAAELYVSLSTVKTHLSSVQLKLAAWNRVEIAAWACQHDQVRPGS